MTTTITREERERVAKLLGIDGTLIDQLGPTAKSLVLGDIDRVAQALRDAAPQWREVTETEPAIGVCVLLANSNGCAVGVRDDVNNQRTWFVNGMRLVDVSREMVWMPLPAPPEPKPAPAPAPRPIAQPGASEAARIEALERTVAELALAVERLTGGAK